MANGIEAAKPTPAVAKAELFMKFLLFVIVLIFS
jgi:hypothetical protein